MDTPFQLIVLLISVIIISGDLSHLFVPEYGFFQTPHQQLQVPFLYSPPQQHPQSPPQSVSPISTSTEFSLPEIVINRKLNDHQHGNFIPLNHYLPPPVMDDGVSSIQDQPASVYLPPKREEQPKPIVALDEPLQQGYEYEKPSSTSRPLTEEPPLQFPPALLPPIADAPFANRPQSSTEESASGYHYPSPGSSYLPPAGTRDSGLRLHVKEMRCLDYEGGFFRAVFKVESFLGAIPVVDNDSNDPKCDLKFSRSYLVVNIAAEDFKKCGVWHCEKELCLRLRFPSIRSMRTSADSILSLHCKTQNRIAIKTHALRMGVSNELQSRSGGVYARGGSQNEFRTHVELLRKSSNGYTKHLEKNGLVQLGENLLLRAHVIADDGWNHTKLTEVSLQRTSLSGEIISSVDLITSGGCVNPSMRSVCSHVPVFEAPLGHRLAFKAVMFQGMHSGDEMVLSMKITGCLERNDCFVNIEECSGGHSGRHKRNSKYNSTEFSEISKISFRVAVPKDEDVGQTISDGSFPHIEPNSEIKKLIICGVLLFVGMICILGLYVYCSVKK